MKFHLPFGIRPSDKYFSCISKEEYQELMRYATERGVRLEGFKRFSGEVPLIKELIEDVVNVAKDFPEILVGRKSVVVRLDDYAPDNDFATTDRHLISINSKMYNDKEYLKREYITLSEQGKFVKGTDYRGVIRHELGHVVANVYGIVSMEVAKEIMPNQRIPKILEYVHDNVSEYAAAYEDGREFISECFSAYYGCVNNQFAKKYVEICKKKAKEDVQ